jgi:hypothetical protein
MKDRCEVGAISDLEGGSPSAPSTQTRAVVAAQGWSGPRVRSDCRFVVRLGSV